MRILKWYLSYFSYVIRHKWFVMIACFKMWLYRQGLIHDLSKFRPSEAKRYMRRFSLWDKSIEGKYDYAWNHHIKRNKHHRQYWLLRFDEWWHTKALRMPNKYAKEMLCDWWWVGRAFARTKEDRGKYKKSSWFEVYTWYHKNKHDITIHHRTRWLIEIFLERQRVAFIRKAKKNWWNILDFYPYEY